MATHHKASIEFVCAASGMGKGVHVKGKLRAIRPARSLIWDVMDEYKEFAPRALTMKTLVECVAKAGAGPFQLRYVPPQKDQKETDKQFAVFCQLAFQAGNCLVLVEEASIVTSASHAPAPWKRLVNMGRHRGLQIICVSQYPAQVDTGIRGSATVYHTGHLGNVRHRKAVAEELDIHPDEIRNLEPFEWIEKDMGTKAITRGKTDFPAPTPTGSSSKPKDTTGGIFGV